MLAIVAAFVFLAVTTPGFLTTANLRSVLDQSAFLGVFAVGTALLMISGNLFSLSISATGAVTASMALYLLPHGALLAIPCAVAGGVVIFAIQGLIIGALGANPIIVSIAAGGLQEGIFLWLSKGSTILPPLGNTSLSFTEHLVHLPLIGSLPVVCFILLGVVVVVEIVLRRTTFGRMLFLVGENRRAAHAAGIPTGWIIIGAFALAGLCIGIVGVEIGAFNGSGSLLDESTYTYDGIAAAVVGGIAVTGGRGSAWQALLGAVFVQAVADLMLLRGYTEGWQLLAKGIVVFAVVVLVGLIRARPSA
jgi:ribose/xylose/arabinose/galactoside ABC-type transport system permease subunit